MNKSYTLVWNQATGCWNVASEGTRRRSKSGRGKALVVAGASLLGLFCQAPAFAPPSGATVVSGDAGFQTSTDGRHMVIDQQSHKLITTGTSSASVPMSGSASTSRARTPSP